MKIIILLSVILGTLCFLGCQETTTKDKEKKDKPLVDISGNPEVPILYTKEQMDAIKQSEKLQANKNTRAKLEIGQYVCLALILLGGVAFFFVPAPLKKYAGAATFSGIGLLIVFSALSRYLDLFNIIALISILIIMGIAAFAGIMWVRAHGWFSLSVETNEKAKKEVEERHPAAAKILKDVWAKHNDKIKDPVRSVKEKLKEKNP